MKRYAIVVLTVVAIQASVVCQTAGGSSIPSSIVQYMSGEDTVQAFLALPEDAHPRPAVILIHEWWGLNDWMRQNAREFADRGYIALAIDLYRGSSTASADTAHELMRGLPEDRAARDLRAAYEFLAARNDVQPSKIGTVGWCMGGGYSLVAAMNIPALAAAVVCYGRLVSDSSSIQKIGVPLLGIFGEQDNGIPAKTVRAFETLGQGLGKNIVVHLYPHAGHAFMNPNNTKGFNESARTEAWKQIWDFLDSQLKSR